MKKTNIIPRIPGKKIPSKLSIRFRKIGHKMLPSYEIVVVRQGSAVQASTIAKIGFYWKMTTGHFINLNFRNYSYWLHRGAIPTPAVDRVLDWNPPVN